MVTRVLGPLGVVFAALTARLEASVLIGAIRVLLTLVVIQMLTAPGRHVLRQLWPTLTNGATA
jgi:hypothetical protein